MKQKKNRIGAGDIALAVVSVVFLVGICSFFGACGPKEDGSFMTCHWANQALIGLAAVLTVLAAAHLCIPDAKIKMGLDIAVIPVALLAAILPGNLIHLCMMSTMRCRAVMRPAVILVSVVTIIVAVADLLLRHKAD